MFDDYDDDGGWSYNDDLGHDMWTDYSSDMYGGSGYSGECPDLDDDWGGYVDPCFNRGVDPDLDADFDADFDGVDDYDNRPDYDRYDSHGTYASAYAADNHNDLVSRMSIYDYESRIHHLEGMLAGAVAAAALLDTKLAKAKASDANLADAISNGMVSSSTNAANSIKAKKDRSDRNIRQLKSSVESKHEEVSRYQAELDKLRAEYEPLKIQAERRRTRIIAIVCAAVCLVAILIAVL